MKYEIYFDESNKLDQPNGSYSYYGAFGADNAITKKITDYIKSIYNNLQTNKEMHFVDYTSDSQFEKYFRAMNYVLKHDISINIMIVNKYDASTIAKEMGITLLNLRELFYVKIPERLFYGMTRQLRQGSNVKIVIDENSEYEKINLENKLKEQMNAHAAYRNKRYTVDKVMQMSSNESIPVQVIDVFMGMIVFLLENQKQTENELKYNTSLMVKSDLIYRILIQDDNLKKFHEKIKLFNWSGNVQSIEEINLSDYTGNFILYKSQFDTQEMNRLSEYLIKYPNRSTKYYREQMGYTNRQLKMLQGYIDEIKGKGRNGYFTS